MTDGLKDCPFCRQPLTISNRVNPTARCDTEGCWVHESKFAIPTDSPLMVERWNQRKPDAALVEALESIDVWLSDTLSGRVKPDAATYRQWLIDGIVEARKRARQALATLTARAGG